MPGIDGLRAIAVMAVLFYHADFAWARGGFLGVEVFFVISGYLITSLLLVEWLRTGTIGLKAFWIRRARRLLPALFLVLVVVSAAAILVYQNTLNRMFGDVLAASGYVTNWFLIVREVSYFETFGRPPLLQHLWSLSVEEQFYVLWPVIFSVGMALFSRKDTRRTIRSFLAMTLLGIAGSTVLMAVLYTPFEDPSRVYYGTDTRAAGLLVGVALALVWMPWRLPRSVAPGPKRTLNVAGGVAIVGLLIVLSRMDEFSPFLYRGGFLLTSVLTAIVIAVTVHPAASLAGILDRPVMRWIGTRSYGIYLWHWPIFMITRPGIDIAGNAYATFVVRTAITFLFAEASYRFVEVPIRQKGFRGWVVDIRRSFGVTTVRGGSIIAVGALASMVLLVAGLAWGSFVRQAPVTLASEAVGDEPIAVAGIVDPTARDSEGADASTTSTTSSAPAEASTPDTAPSTSITPAPGDTTTTAVAPATTPESLPSVSMIGDSVLAGAQTAVEEAIGNPLVVDAAVNRQFKHAASVVADLRASGTLGSIVVIHLGTNGAFSDETFDSLMESVEGVDRLIVVTAKVPRRWEERVNAAIASGAERFPAVEVLDWHEIAAPHPEWFRDDQVHLNRAGMEAYARALAGAING